MELSLTHFGDLSESQILRIAEIDIQIPKMFDEDIIRSQESFEKKVKFVKELKSDDFAYAYILNEKVVAYHISVKSKFFGRPVANVYSTWVDPQFRRQGIASYLKTCGEKWAQENGIYCLFTHAMKKNEPSVEMNIRNGYEIVSYRMKKVIAK